MSAYPSTRKTHVFPAAVAGIGGAGRGGMAGKLNPAQRIGRGAGRNRVKGARLDAHDVRGVEPLVPLLHFELHHLTFGERLEAVHLNRREMHEHVFATFLLNEAVSFGVIEPLHLSLDHDPPPAESVTGRPALDACPTVVSGRVEMNCG